MRTVLLAVFLLCISSVGLFAQDNSEPDYTIIEWAGDCYNTQVNALGNLTLIKVRQQGKYSATLLGDLEVYMPVDGWNRHELPPGFLPDTTDRRKYQCSFALHEGSQAIVNVSRGDELIDQVYENGSIFFSETIQNGNYSLRCQWDTKQEDPSPVAWQQCPSITVKRLMSTPTFVPTSATSITPIPNVTPTVLATPQPEQRKLFIPQAHANLCLPGSCN